MRLFSKPHHHKVAVGIVAAVLGLSALSGATYAQDSTASAGNQRMTAGADTDVAARVKAALNSDATLDSKHIDVSVQKDNVVLTGYVQSAHGVTDATRIATKAAGTHKIVNNLTVQQNAPNAP
jgi:osmotically-inducible protein OsmY